MRAEPVAFMLQVTQSRGMHETETASSTRRIWSRAPVCYCDCIRCGALSPMPPGSVWNETSVSSGHHRYLLGSWHVRTPRLQHEQRLRIVISLAHRQRTAADVGTAWLLARSVAAVLDR